VSPVASAAAGFGLGASLIIAIGAQNAFVLRQGLRREHVLLVAATCATIDAVLIAFGAGGFGALVSGSPVITSVAAWGGAAFLFVYGLRSFRAAASPGGLEARAGDELQVTSRAAALGTTLAVSLLNPHVYLDTVVLLGSVAAQRAMPERAWFALGAMVASVGWFFSLGYGARLLAPIFARPRAWQALDVAIGIVMWWIATSLVLGQLSA
jgi:L-lysine exporter family protein LysE/ArgO